MMLHNTSFSAGMWDESATYKVNHMLYSFDNNYMCTDRSIQYKIMYKLYLIIFLERYGDMHTYFKHYKFYMMTYVNYNCMQN